MEIFMENTDQLKRDIQTLKRELIKCNNPKKAKYLMYSIKSLLYIYEDVEIYDKSIQNYSMDNAYIKQIAKTDRKNSKIFMNNFISVKNYHNFLTFALNDNLNVTMDKLEKVLDDNSNEDNNNFIISEKEMYEIINQFFVENNLDKKFNEIIKSNLIYKGDIKRPEKGYMMLDFYNSVPRICIDKNSPCFDIMYCLVHEIAHIIDLEEDDLIHYPKKLFQYYEKSIYGETISTLYEKKFIDFLIKNNLYSDRAYIQNLENYQNGFYYMEDVNILSQIPSKYLKDEKYKEIYNTDQLITNPLLFNKKGAIDFKNLNINDSLQYFYGFLLTTYFNYLSKNDTDEFNYKFNNFIKQRNNLFSVINFQGLIGDIDSLSKIIKKEIDSDLDVKQKKLQKKIV